MKKENENSIGLNKYISSTGMSSRREADRWIEAGLVTLNGQPTKLGNRVEEGDVVRVRGEILQSKPKALYIAFNKPIGIVCTTDPKEPRNIVKYIDHPQRLFPIGRLDMASQGLIFMTNDGDIVNKILRSHNNHEKEYVVTIDNRIQQGFIRHMANGVEILGTVTKKCKVNQLDDFNFKIVLTQGLNRQIRRMCTELGYEVTRLKRVRIMNIKLDRLKVGHWRELTAEEMIKINSLVADSSKEHK